MASEPKEIKGKYPGSYNQKEAAKIASAVEHKTILWINLNSGTLYGNTDDKHAEVVMMDNIQSSDITKIHTVYIRNTPCHDCSTKMIKFFQKTKQKPIIYMYIGKKWKHYNTKHDENEQGLIDLIKNGFRLRGWKEFKYHKWIKGETSEDRIMNNKGENWEDHLANIKDRIIKEMREENDTPKATPTTN